MPAPPLLSGSPSGSDEDELRWICIHSRASQGARLNIATSARNINNTVIIPPPLISFSHYSLTLLVGTPVPKKKRILIHHARFMVNLFKFNFGNVFKRDRIFQVKNVITQLKDQL